MVMFDEGDRYLLIGLRDYRARFLHGNERVEFARLMDVGGKSGSDHASAAKRLTRLGLVERQQRTDTGKSAPLRSRGSYEYKITQAGLDLLEGPVRESEAERRQRCQLEK